MISNLNTFDAELDPSSKKIEYVLFENLLPFNDLEDLESYGNLIICELKDESQWLNQYEALNTLRRINKFANFFLNSLLPQVALMITKLTCSIRSNLSKLSIMLIKEIFTNQNISSQNFKYIKNFISAVTCQSASMKIFIKEESLACLDALSKNYIFFNISIIIYLIEDVSSKSLNQSENAFNTILKLVENWSKEDIFSGTIYSQWEAVFLHIINLYLLKREPYVKRACKIMETFYNKFGEDDFQNILNLIALDQTNKNLIVNIIKQADTKKKKNTESMKELISKNKINK
jgi:hypothetical protein